MTDEKNIVQIIRKRKRYKPFELREPRLRNSCPKCGSLDVKKKRGNYNYKCGRCGWEGESVTKIIY